MKALSMSSLAGLLLTTALASAQPQPSPEPPPVAVPPEAAAPATFVGLPAVVRDNFPASRSANAPNGTSCWVSAEYLLWWLQRDRPGTPLLTTGSPNDQAPGALGQPGTQVLATARTIEPQVFSGLRLGYGRWWDPNQTLGFELGGFLLAQRSEFYHIRANTAGNPILAIPFIDLNPAVNGPSANLITFPDFISGAAALRTTTNFWGLEASTVCPAGPGLWRNVRLLAGLRYLDLLESFTAYTATNSINGTVLSFLNGAVPRGLTLATIDDFRTRNQFYGGQVGAQGEYRLGGVLLGASLKLAVGNTHQGVHVSGSTLEVNQFAASFGSASGGVTALPSNGGIVSADQFTILPETQLKIGYDWCETVSLSLAWNALWWSSVARPFGQYPPVVNSTQFPSDTTFGTGGPTVPEHVLHRSSFWAQGLTVTLAWQY